MRIATLLLGLIGMAFLCGVLQAAPPIGKVHLWTDQQGRQIEAKLLRVNPDNIVLEVDGQPTFVPLEQLSAADQAYLAGSEPAPAAGGPNTATSTPPASEEPRLWTVNGKQFSAIWSAAGDENFVLQTPTGNMQISYDAVSDRGDAEDLVRRLRSARRSDLAERVIAAYERNSGQKFDPTEEPPQKPMLESPVDPQANAIPDDQLPERGGSKIATADSMFGQESGEDSPEHQAALAAFRRKVMLGGVALVVLIGGIAAYGYMSIRKV